MLPLRINVNFKLKDTTLKSSHVYAKLGGLSRLFRKRVPYYRAAYTADASEMEETVGNEIS